MSRLRSFFKYWFPVMIWMVIIFSASGDKDSFGRSSRIIGPLVHWLFPQMPEDAVNTIVTAVRKAAHLAEYAILGLLLWRAMRKPVKRDPRPWSRGVAMRAVALVALYAATDELHQHFVPSRYGSFLDVLLDTTGAILGLLLLWMLLKWRARRIVRLAKNDASIETGTEHQERKPQKTSPADGSKSD